MAAEKPTRSGDVEHDGAHSEAAEFCARTVLPATTDRLLVVLFADGCIQCKLQNTRVKPYRLIMYVCEALSRYRLLLCTNACTIAKSVSLVPL